MRRISLSGLAGLPGTAVATGLLLFLAISPPASGAPTGTPNPHGEGGAPSCFYCHSEDMYETVDPRNRSHLLFDKIDHVCLKCHSGDGCCSIGFLSEPSLCPGPGQHPSDIPIAETTLRPRELPVFDGRIACATCHRHDRKGHRDHLRLGLIVGSGADRALREALCADCHGSTPVSLSGTGNP